VTPRPDLARVVVVGTSCSGKTTFGRRLASLVDSPFIELDSLYWGPAWTRRPEFQTDVHAVVEQPRWVIDGNYSAVRDAIWRRSTAIVWLDYSFARVFSRALVRTARRIMSREQLYGGNRETIRTALLDRDGVPWWVIRTHGRRRREYPAFLGRPEYAQATVVRLDRPAAAEAFLAEPRVDMPQEGG
jgi:adenylate kinase family enzyme